MNTPTIEYSVQRRRPSRLRVGGFTLVEVMVALIIIAIGMLGFAKMQALALSNTGASRSRALAAIEASSLAAAMHANRSYWSAASSVPGTISVTTTTGSAAIASTSATMQTALTSVEGSLCTTGAKMGSKLSCYCLSGVSAPCSATYVNMAASDLYDWSAGLASLLPSSTATVTCTNSNVPVDCTIAINWTENSVALTQQEAAAAAANSNTSQATTAALQYVTYNLYVVP